METIDVSRGKRNGNGHRARGRSPARARARRGDADLSALLGALQSVERGDFSVRLSHDAPGLMGEVMSAFNRVVRRNEAMAGEIARVGRMVGREGRVEDRAAIGDARGAWAEAVESINTLIGELVWPTSEV